MTAYALGVDLGTTYSAAAIARGADARPLPLSTDTAQMPSVVVLREDGEVLVGESAERRSTVEPLRTAREFKRRLGDPVPIVIGQTSHSIESLMAHVLRAIVRRATEQEGEAPSLVVLTHPANYYGYKIATLREAARLAGLDPTRVLLLTEPEAAAIAYSRQQPIADGEVVAVYDFGGGTFDAAVLRRTGNRFELIGTPEGMDRLGGIDIDLAVLAHVDDLLAGRISSADGSDPAVVAGVARLRTECRRVKEALSSDTDAAISVAVPPTATELRMTRSELEAMVRPRVTDTIQSLQRAVASAGVSMDQVSRVLLVGGTSRLPLVAEMVRQATGRPVVLDAHPKLAVAVGASLAGAAMVSPVSPVSPATPPTPGPVGGAPMPPPPPGAVDGGWQAPVPAAATAPTAPPPPAPFRTVTASEPVAVKRRPSWLVLGAVGAAIGVAAVVGVVALSGGDDDATPTTAAGSESAELTVTPLAFGGAPGAGIPGPAASAGVSAIVGVAAERGEAVVVLTPEGSVLRVAGGTVALVAQLEPTAGAVGGIAVAPDGTIAVSTATGVVAVTDGGATPLFDPTAAGLGSTPGPVAFDAAGNLYVADGDQHRIIRRAVDGALTLVAGNGLVPDVGVVSGDGDRAGDVAVGTVVAMDIDAAGDLVFVDGVASAVRSIAPDGTIGTLASGATAADVRGLAVDGSGAAWVTQRSTGRIVRIARSGSTETMLTVDPQTLGALTVADDGSVMFDQAATLQLLSATRG